MHTAVQAVAQSSIGDDEMGVYVRPNSPFYWMTLECPGQESIRVSTKIPVQGGTDEQRKKNRRLAQEVYAAAMGDLAKERFLSERLPPATRKPRQKTVTITKLPDRLKAKGWCYIYFAQRENVVKIGRCLDVDRRIDELQTANSEQLTLLAVTVAHGSLEEYIHCQFSGCRRIGEWFELTDALRAYIDAVDAGLNPVMLL